MNGTEKAGYADFAAANELHIAEDYDAAAVLYDKAILQNDSEPTFLLHRATNSMKRSPPQFVGQ